MSHIDLHSHSCASDGILNPEDLVSSAKYHGVEVLALTDHDTVSGVAAAQARAREEGIHLIPGIEFSATWRGISLHILGLGIDPNADTLLQATARQAQARETRAQLIAARLTKHGFNDALAGAEQHAQGRQVGRAHFARFLLESGQVTSLKQAFKHYLGAGKIGDVKHLWPELSEVVEWIHGAGGAAVLAHPRRYKMTNTKLRALLADFAAAGGDGMEVICGPQNTPVTEYLADLSLDFELYASAGSDFHGPVSRWQKPGAFGTLPARCRPLPM